MTVPTPEFQAPPADDAPEARRRTPEPDDRDDLDEPFDEARAKEALRKKNSEAENLRKRLKELEPQAAKARELEESQKTETQRLTERIADLEKTSGDAVSEAMRLRVALANAPEGAKPEQILRAAKRLAGATEEELAADAVEYFADFAGGKTPPTRKPNERLRGGSDPDAEPEENDPRKLAASIAPRRL